MTGRDCIAITGAHDFGISAALIASLGAAGVIVVNLEDEPEQMILRRDATLDRLDMLDMLIGARPQSGRPSTYEPGPLTRRKITFLDTPKPLSKRRARRLRAKAAAPKVAAPEDDQRCPDCGFLACICFQDDDRDEEDDTADCCMMGPDGLCGAAGSEFCDWECPTMRAAHRGDLA